MEVFEPKRVNSDYLKHGVNSFRPGGHLIKVYIVFICNYCKEFLQKIYKYSMHLIN